MLSWTRRKQPIHTPKCRRPSMRTVSFLQERRSGGLCCPARSLPNSSRSFQSVSACDFSSHTILLAAPVFGASSVIVSTITEFPSACPAKFTTATTPTSAPATVWSSRGGSSTISAAGGPTLVPGPVPGGNPGDYGHLSPNETGTMYYCAGGSLGTYNAISFRKSSLTVLRTPAPR